MRRNLLALMLAAVLAAFSACGPQSQVAAGGGSVSAGEEGPVSSASPAEDSSAAPSAGESTALPPEESSAAPSAGESTVPVDVSFSFPELGEVVETTSEEVAAMTAMAEDFAINHIYPFDSTQGQVNVRFVLLHLYEEHPEWEDKDGVIWVPLEEFAREVWLRYGIQGYKFQSPEQENVYPRYVAEKGAIAFYAAGEAPSWVAEVVGSFSSGDVQGYTINLYDDFITDGHEKRTWERQLMYAFRPGRREDGELVLQAVSARETPFIPREALGEEETRWVELAKSFCVSGVTVGETLTDRDKADFFRFIIASPLYGDKLAEWKTAEGYVVPLADIEEIIFTHLGTDSFDPAAGFPEANQWQGYDAGAGVYRMDAVGGYGGARALQVLEYSEEEGHIRIVLGSYDMGLFYSEPPQYQLVERWETELLLLGEGKREFRVLRSEGTGV